MIRKIIFSICMICLLLAGCTDDDMMPSSQISLSSKTVPVRLNFSTEAFNTPLQGDTRAEGESFVLSVSNQDMDIELVKTPVTRGAAAAIDKETAVYNYTVLQFAGTTETSLLFGKTTYPCPEGIIKTADVELLATTTGSGGGAVKHRFVVIANVDATDFNALQTGISTYSDLQNMNISQAGNPIFPLHKVTTANGVKDAMIMCGSVDAIINTGESKQISIALQRTVAKVTFNIKTDNPAFNKLENWDLILMSIPNKSYFNTLGRVAIFPATDPMNLYAAYWAQPLTSTQGEALPLNGKFSYLPVNLQQPVVTVTQSTRRDNAPIGGTYLQIMGRKMAPLGVIALPVVKDFVFYQIYLGKNLTTDFSVYPNYDLTYNITLKGRADEDTNVVRFIPGYFSGGLKAYDSSGAALTSITDPAARKWEYSKRLEAYFKDSPYPMITHGPIEEVGRLDLQWYEGNAYNNLGATSLTNGYDNTRKLQGNSTTFLRYPAALACYSGLNGLNSVSEASFAWYLPSISELVGTWISSASTVNQLSTSYWSSTALNDNSQRAFIITNEGEVKTALVNSDTDRHYVRGFRDPDVLNVNQ